LIGSRRPRAFQRKHQIPDQLRKPHGSAAEVVEMVKWCRSGEVVPDVRALEALSVNGSRIIGGAA